MNAGTAVSTARPIRVLCVDKYRLVREGIVLILASDPSISVVGAVASGEEAIEHYIRDKPDLVLIDIQLQTGMSCCEAIRIIRQIDPTARMAVLTMLDGDEDIRRSLEAGALTYLLKDMAPHELTATVHQVARGRSVLPSSIAKRLAKGEGSPRLTSRQVRVLELIAEGFRNKEIADKLRCSEGTIHNHVKQILQRLNVNDRNGAITAAIRRGIIHVR
jgi:DNA-binding NarL/FixJ family response regulator